MPQVVSGHMGARPRAKSDLIGPQGPSGGTDPLVLKLSAPTAVLVLERAFLSSMRMPDSRCARVLSTISRVLASARMADVLEHRLFLIGADIAQW
jgi:hypothetical protein